MYNFIRGLLDIYSISDAHENSNTFIVKHKPYFGEECVYSKLFPWHFWYIYHYVNVSGIKVYLIHYDFIVILCFVIRFISISMFDHFWWDKNSLKIWLFVEFKGVNLPDEFFKYYLGNLSSRYRCLS